ncbi:MAG: response regulator [Lachnospiraceae bacterium]|nr:response regulator [Lachnospiraceae bacterium]
MNLLIVDDEYYSVESIRMKVEAHFTDFEEIFCAYSMEEALQIIEEQEISVMLSDIEMPGGSGLDLLEEMRRRGKNTVCVFLTAYAKFEYANRAMRLSSIDYLLKPVAEEDLVLTLRKAIDEWEAISLAEKDTLLASYWESSENHLIEMFWYQYLHHFLSDDLFSAKQELKRQNLPLSILDSNYYLLLVRCSKVAEAIFESELFDFTVRNILREYFYREEEYRIIIRDGSFSFLMILSEEMHTREELAARAREALTDFVPHFPNHFSFYISATSKGISELPAQYDHLVESAKNDLILTNQIIDLSMNSTAHPYEERSYPFEKWGDLLLKRKTDDVLSSVQMAVEGMKRDPSTSKEDVTSFFYRFLQMLYSAMAQNKAALSRFNAELSQMSADEACTSIESLENWIRMVVPLFNMCMYSTDDQDAVVREVQAYIHSHLSENMTRESLSSMVYLNPDYLSFRFKKVTGMSLANYIIHARIQESMRLLGNREMSIRDIALDCGFSNLSYFAKQFKKETGLTPRDFRK